jgi:poly-gamma-glutamate synthesis protein (capsule biosynthesis protein)
MLGRGVSDVVNQHGPYFPFAHVNQVLTEADLSIANLESPISDRGQPNPISNVNFRASKEAASGLRVFNLLCLANNHILDYGIEAAQDTKNILNEHGICAIGVGKDYLEARQPAILELSRIRIGVLNYTSMWNVTDAKSEYVAAPLRQIDWFCQDISQLKKKVDVVILSLHIGREMCQHPAPFDREQALMAIDAGADIVVGHHPHVLQGIEAYKQGIILYSLGDFVFDGIEPLRRESAIFRCMVDNYGAWALDVCPVSINNQYQPTLADESTRQHILQRLKYLSSCIGDGSYSQLFWNQARQGFIENQKASLRNLTGRVGLMKAILIKSRHLKRYHIRILLQMVRNSIKDRIFRR